MGTFIEEQKAVNVQLTQCVEEQKVVNVQTNQRIDTMESSLNQKLDGLQSKLDQKIDILQYSISRLANQQHIHQEEECLIDTILGEQAQLQQLQEELIEELAKAFEELQDALELGAIYGPWRRKEEISPMLTEEGSGKEAVEEQKMLILQPIPIKLNPSATA